MESGALVRTSGCPAQCPISAGRIPCLYPLEDRAIGFSAPGSQAFPRPSTANPICCPGTNQIPSRPARRTRPRRQQSQRRQRRQRQRGQQGQQGQQGRQGQQGQRGQQGRQGQRGQHLQSRVAAAHPGAVPLYSRALPGRARLGARNATPVPFV
ncbi:MAG: hypothetical protein FJY39_03915 [Betaproteobacteria bacterium]|nr:hypothetical protein [Betaproteobacteria bacterium]